MATVSDAAVAALAPLTRLTLLDLAGSLDMTDKGVPSDSGSLVLCLPILASAHFCASSGLALSCDGTLLPRTADLFLLPAPRFLSQTMLCAGLAKLQSLTRLQDLTLWNCLGISDAGLAALPSLQALSALCLRGCQQLSDRIIQPLASFPKLQRLDLRACERFTGR